MFDLYKVYEKGVFIGQCHAEDEDDAIATMMSRLGYPLLQSFDNFTAEKE